MNCIRTLRIFLNYKILVLLSSFLFSGVALAATSEILSYKNLPISIQREFQNLLHIKNGKPRADQDHFYLSSYKKRTSTFSIEDEFQNTLHAFATDPNRETGYFKYPLRCVFVERLHLLQSLGLFLDLTSSDCEALNKWKEGLKVKSISLVFSASYPNNPSSMFGHTLLRLNQEKGSDLLDYTVAFSAWQDVQESGLFLAIKGLFGGYRGLIDMSKYYQKVGEYNYFESRDLIEYKLKMSEHEIERFLNHLWEIYQTSYFDYYFIDENCSSLLFDMLEVAYQDKILPLKNRWYYLPGELVQAMSVAGLIEGESKVRPSLKKSFERKYEALDAHEKEFFRILIGGKDLDFQNFKNEQNAKTLTAAIDYFYYKKARLKGNLDKDPLDEGKRLSDILKLRASLGVMEEVKVQKKDLGHVERPELAHGPKTLKAGFGRYQNQNMLSFGFKEGYHSFLNSDAGHETFSQFDFGSLNFSYLTKEKKLFVKDADLLNLKSLHPWSFYDPQASWQGELSYEDVDRKNHFTEFSLGMGYAVDLMSKRIRTGFFVSSFMGVTKNTFNFGPKLEFLLLVSPMDKIKTKLSTKTYYFHKKFMQDHLMSALELDLRYLVSDNTSIGIAGKKFESTKLDSVVSFEWNY